MKPKTFYISPFVEKSKQVEVLGMRTELTLSWADGQIGACAVFTNKKKAIAFVGKENAHLVMIAELTEDTK